MISKRHMLLYAAYTSTCLEDRAWSFFVSIVLESAGGMRFVSIGQFSESLLQMIVSGFLGRFIDRISRRNAIILVVLLNNLSILIAAGLFLILTDESQNFLNVPIAFCAMNRLFLNAEKSIISRDWIVLLGDESTLSTRNAIMTTFDQVLNVLAPIIVGVWMSEIVSENGLRWLQTLTTAFGIERTLVIFGIGSVFSLASKSLFLCLTYRSTEALRYKKHLMTSSFTSFSSSENTSSSSESENRNVLLTYWRQKTFSAALGMALFYKTVMGFDNLAVGYASSSSDLSVFTIGILKAYGAVAGMLGSISYAVLEKRIGLIGAGMVGLAVQQTCALIAVATIWMPGSPFIGARPGYSIPVFLVAIATARYGLWCLDLAVTHSMQIHVAETERNTVFGVHMALCQAFSVPKELLVIAFPEPSHFAFYIVASYFFVTAGDVLFYRYTKMNK